MKAPITIYHRRNRVDQLEGLPKGCWVELDIEIYENKAYLTHDPIQDKGHLPELFEDYLPVALEKGVVGFVVDCKRECAEKWVAPLMEKHRVTDYYYLNEMEVQADIFQSLDPNHKSGIRIWKYHSANDIIRYAEDMTADGGTFPKWVWFDCWQRGLLTDITKAYVPANGTDVRKLQSLGVKMCICSPELYIHKYDTPYTEEELKVFYRGTLAYRKKLLAEGIVPDAFCSKFPHIWLTPVEEIEKTL